MSNIPEIYAELPEFRRRFFNGEKDFRWHIQKLKNHTKEFGYSRRSTPLTDAMLVQHFKQKPIVDAAYTYGSLASVGTFNGRIRWVAVDADNLMEYTDVFQKLLPVFDKYRIDYVIEHSRENRCHIWFLCDSRFSPINLFVQKLLNEAGCSIQEVFPLAAGKASRKSNIIRLPGGVHLTNGKANPIEYGGITSNDPVFILKTFNRLKILSEGEILGFIQDSNLPPILEEGKKGELPKWVGTTFYYTPRNLKLPMKLPSLIGKVASNCQAINKVIAEVIDDKMIEQRGGVHHDAGLRLSGLAKFHDKKTRTTNGEDWFEELKTKYRLRDASSHHWEGTGDDKPAYQYFAACNKWEDFGHCGGCPFRGQAGFYSPRQFINRKEIERVKVKEVNLVSAEEVREKTFVRFREEVHRLLVNKESADLLLASSQGAGKTVASDKLVANLAKHGYRCLLAVPTGELAITHQKTIQALGQEAFVLMSHENMFGHQAQPPKRTTFANFDCPSYEPMQEKFKLGVKSTLLKNKYCKECPWIESCPYPTQYKDVMDEKNKIVIIQHAHFSAREVLFSLLDKQFDVLVVDESFIDSLKIEIKPSESELEILRGQVDIVPWLNRLLRWFDGHGASGKIMPSESDLNHLLAILNENMIPWNLPDYIRVFNQGRFYRPSSGLLIFNSLPNIQVRIFTDATPPLEELELVLHSKIKVFGQDEILDPRIYHPDNRVIQVLDSSLSKTSLEKNDWEKFYNILDFIGEQASTEFKEDKVLITLYKSHKEAAEEWLFKNYPQIMARVTFNHMTVGSNAYISYNVQFLLCGVYMTSEHYEQEVYEIKSIVNYWRGLGGISLITNIPPIEGEVSPTQFKEDVVRRIEPDGIFEYPQFKTYVPYYSFERMVYNHNIGRTQQSIRLRFANKEENPNRKVVYIFSNMNFPSLLITDSLVLGGLIKNNEEITKN